MSVITETGADAVLSRFGWTPDEEDLADKIAASHEETERRIEQILALILEPTAAGGAGPPVQVQRERIHAVMRARFLDGMTSKEVAGKLGIRQRQVVGLLTRGLRILRSQEYAVKLAMITGKTDAIPDAAAMDLRAENRHRAKNHGPTHEDIFPPDTKEYYLGQVRRYLGKRDSQQPT